MFSHPTQVNTQSFDHKASARDLLDRLWANRLKDGHRNELIHDYFQCLTGKPFSSKTREIDHWIYEVLSAIESFQDEEKLIDLLRGEKQQSSSIRTWLNRIPGKLIGVAEEEGSKKQGNALESLLKNLGFNNTFSLLGRSYQLARQLRENKGIGWQKLEKTKTIFENLLHQLARQYDINLIKLTFDEKEVSSEFLSRLGPTNSNNTRRNQLIGGVALVALGIAYACVYNGYSPYNHFSSHQALQGQGNPLTQPNQEIGQNIPQFNVLPEQPFDLSSKKISKLEADVSTNPETVIWKNLNSYVSSFWSQHGKSTSFHTTSFYSINGIEMPFYDEAVKINLHDLYEMTEEERQDVIKKFELQSNIDSLGKDNFFKKLAELDKQTLKLANLVDLKFYSETSGLKYILINKIEFNHLTLEEVKDISLDQSRIIIERLKSISKESVLDNDLNENTLQLSLVKFSNLNSEQINRLIHQIPENAFSLISDDQLIGLDLQKISQEQANHLFNVNPEKIDLLSSDQLNAVFDKLSDFNLKYHITDDQFKQLNLATLRADQIQNLLYKDPSKRIALLSLDQFNAVFDKLSDLNLKYHITDDQFKQLNLATLRADQIQNLLYKDPSKRIALLSSDQLNAVFDKLSDFNLKYHITDDQFKQFNLATLMADQIQNLLYKDPSKRIALLSSDQFNAVFDKLSDLNLKYHITDDQFKQLNLATLRADQIQNLLYKDPSKRIALLSSDQFNAVFDKLSDLNLKLHITDDQFKQLNLATLRADQIQNLLYKDPSKRIAFLSSDQLNAVFDNLSDLNLKFHIVDNQLKSLDMSKRSAKQVDLLFPGWSIEKLRQQYTSNGKLSISENELTKMCDQIKNKNINRLSLLSNSQLNHIRGKLSKENQELINS